MTDCDRLLEVLSDGKPHSHHELYALGMIVHSRVSNLRKKGYTIHQWRVQPRGAFTYRNRPTYWYRLAPLNAVAVLPGAGHVVPSSATETATALSGARSTLGAHPTGGQGQESVFSSEPVSLPLPPPITSTASLAAGESEMRPTLFDVPSTPAWA